MKKEIMALLKHIKRLHEEQAETECLLSALGVKLAGYHIRPIQIYKGWGKVVKDEEVRYVEHEEGRGRIRYATVDGVDFMQYGNIDDEGVVRYE